MRQQRDDDQVVGGRLVQHAGNADTGAFTLDIDDRAVTFELPQPDGARPRNGSDIVTASPSQLKGEGAADLPGAEDGDPQRRGGCMHDGLRGHRSTCRM